MKNLFTFSLLILVITSSVFCQPPQAFKYQAVVRNATGDIISNESVDVRISIIDNWSVGPVIYQETHSVTTNQFGLINLSIGWGTPGLGYNFQNINWSLNEKFIQVEILDDAGSSWLSMGTSRLFSVPYALYSGDDGDWIKDGDHILAGNIGNVGIGTITPDEKLHVNDRIRIGEDPAYANVYGEVIHEGGGNGFKINAEAGGGGWGDLHLQTNGTTKMFIESDGNVGIGTTSPAGRFHVEATSDEIAIKSHSPSGPGLWAESTNQFGIVGASTNYIAGYFNGDVHVNGSLSKGSGSFVIDHPLDPENKLLRHNFVESPENLLIYRGKAELNSYGEATVEMPEYFQALTKEDDASIYLTSVGRPFPTGAEWNNDFSAIIIYGDSNREVFWEVLADRDDPVIHELDRPVEEEKGGDKSICEKGKLLYPEAYGYPESMSHFYEMKQTNK